MIITIGGTKGGTGKSTTAVNLVVLLAKANNVLLIDAATPPTASIFAHKRLQEVNDFTAIRLDGEGLRPHIEREQEKYDFIVIDVGGYDSIAQRYALALCDIYVVPVGPSEPEIYEMLNIEQVIEQVKPINPELKAFTFINRGDPVGHANHEAIDALRSSLRHFTIIDQPVINRKAFRYAFSEGKGIIELMPRDKKAEEEFLNVVGNCLEGVELPSGAKVI